MTRRIILSPDAARDVDDIWTYSARTWSEAPAGRYISGLRDLREASVRSAGTCLAAT